MDGKRKSRRGLGVVSSLSPVMRLFVAAVIVTAILVAVLGVILLKERAEQSAVVGAVALPNFSPLARVGGVAYGKARARCRGANGIQWTAQSGEGACIRSRLPL